MRHSIAAAFGVALGLLTACQAPARDLPPGTHQERNLVYAQPDGTPLHLDLYVPPSKGPVPLIIWVHGGGWSQGDKEDPPGFGFVRHGYALATVQYRLSTQATFPAQIHDVKAAVRFLRANAARFGLDPERFGAWGESAGGHLVALLGTTSVKGELEGSVGVTGVSSAVQAVCDWYGPTDLLKIASEMAAGGPNYDDPESPVSVLLGGPAPDNVKKARSANPIEYVKPGMPPFFIMHGDDDETVPLEQSTALAQALRRVKAEVQFIVIKGGHHSGDFYFTRQKQEMVRRFFDRHLKRAGG